MPDISKEVSISAAPEQVFKAITEQPGLAAWFTEGVTAKPEAGFVIIFKFGGANRTEMRITDLIPCKRVAWECLSADGLDEWVGTTVSFDLDEASGTTLVRFSHANWKQRTAMFAIFDEHWGGYMKSLKAYCETGKGMPFGYSTAQGS